MAKKKIIRRNNRPLTYRMPSTSKPDWNTNQYSIGGFLSGLSGKVGSIMGGSKIAGSPMGDAISSIGGAAGQIGGSLIGGGLSLVQAVLLAIQVELQVVQQVQLIQYWVVLYQQVLV